MNTNDFVYIGLPAMLVVVVVALVVFMVIRQFTLWYFRLDSIADNLAKIAKHTEYLATQTPPAGSPAVVAPTPTPPHPPPTVVLTPAPAAPRRFPIGGGAHP